MRRILFSFLLLLFVGNGFAQKGFGVDGSIGVGQNGGDLVYPLLLEGRMQFNDYLSLNLGIGLWNSGLKDSWNVKETETLTIYHISSNKTLPSMQLSTRCQVPIFSYQGKKVRLFAEPTLYFLPFSAQTVNLSETKYKIKTDAVTGDISYEDDGTILTNKKSDCNPRLYGGIQVGLAIELVKNIDFAISYGYTNMDLFKDLRNQSLNEWSLNKYLPRTDLQLLNISFLVNFDLN